MPAALDLAPGSMVAGRYRLLAPAAGRRAGATWRAWDVLDRCPVAVRLIDGRADPAAAARARAAAGLDGAGDPSLRPIQRLHAGLEWLVVVAPWLPGRSLDERLTAGPIAPAEAAAIVRGLLAALVALHARGAVHGAVEPGNVLLVPAGDESAVVLADAGLGDPSAPSPYRSPALRVGRRPTERDDQFAAGVLALACLGVPAGAADHEAAARRLAAERPDVARLAEVAGRLTITAGQLRFASAADALAAWDAAAAPAAPPAVEAPPSEAPAGAVVAAEPAPSEEPTTTVLPAEPAEPPAVKDAPTEPNLPALGTLRLAGSPAGAAVLIDGQPAGALPAIVAGQPPGAHVVRIEAAGFRPQELRIALRGDLDLEVALQPAAGPPPAPATPIAPPPGPIGYAIRAAALVGGLLVLAAGLATGSPPIQVAGLTTTLAAAGSLVAA